MRAKAGLRKILSLRNRNFTWPRNVRSKKELAFGLLTALVLVVFLLGGSSRHDIESLPYLRAFACLAAAAGVFTLDEGAFRDHRGLFWWLGALAALMIAQLVPLPPSWWSALPTRDPIHALDKLVGLSTLWRPITLSPTKTANSLASLIVPLATLVLFVQLTAPQRERILVMLVGIALIDALLGIGQALSGTGSGLYLYEITNRGGMVGLFANRNHHAVFDCCALLIALYLAYSWRARHGLLGPVSCLAAATVLFSAVIANASRAGLICCAAALFMAAIALLASNPTSLSGYPQRLRSPKLIVAALLTPALCLFALFAAAQRSPALARLLGDSQLEDLRARILPHLLDMAVLYQPWGAGFGAFEYAYRMREPAALLMPSYVNNAHNDWLQWIIEGGAPGILLMLAGLVMLSGHVARLARSSAHESPQDRTGWLGAGILVLLSLASLVDYPVRTPSIMCLATLAIVLIWSKPKVIQG